ncbi:MAG: DUF6906 family protein [Paraclostridium sp.]
MKRGKKLTRNQKGFLTKLGLDYSKYLLERQDNRSFTFINLDTNETEKYYFM